MELLLMLVRLGQSCIVLRASLTFLTVCFPSSRPATIAASSSVRWPLSWPSWKIFSTGEVCGGDQFGVGREWKREEFIYRAGSIILEREVS